MTNIMPRTGAWMFTGEHGVGKSSASLEAVAPDRIFLVDDDIKGRATVDQIRADGIKFGAYNDFVEITKGMKRLAIHKAGLEIIDKIVADLYDVVAWDTWTQFEESCATWVQTYPDKFRDKWAQMGKIRVGEEYKQARIYEASLISSMLRKAPMVILVSHLKNHYLNNAATGKMIPAVSKAVNRVCKVRMWLRHNPNHTTPIVLVLKNTDKKVMINGVLRTVKVFPDKMTPREDEMSVWDMFDRYWNEPIGNRKPDPDEVPDDFEMSIVTNTLTDDQRLSWLHSLKESKADQAEQALIELAEKTAKVMELWESGEYESKVKLAKALDMPYKEVSKIIRDAENEDDE